MDKPSNIDPYPILGDILNHLEKMIWATGATVAQILIEARAKGLDSEEIQKFERLMLEAFQHYEDFKRTKGSVVNDEPS